MRRHRTPAHPCPLALPPGSRGPACGSAGERVPRRGCDGGRTPRSWPDERHRPPRLIPLPPKEPSGVDQTRATFRFRGRFRTMTRILGGSAASRMGWCSTAAAACCGGCGGALVGSVPGAGLVISPCEANSPRSRSCRRQRGIPTLGSMGHRGIHRSTGHGFGPNEPLPTAGRRRRCLHPLPTASTRPPLPTSVKKSESSASRSTSVVSVSAGWALRAGTNGSDPSEVPGAASGEGGSLITPRSRQQTRTGACHDRRGTLVTLRWHESGKKTRGEPHLLSSAADPRLWIRRKSACLSWTSCTPCFS